MEIPARFKPLLTPLNLHLGGALLLIALNIYLVVQIAIAVSIKHNNSGEALVEQQQRLHQATIDAQPLRGLDQKLTLAKTDASGFEKSRIAPAQSVVIAELGDLAHRNNVHLSRVQYSPLPPADDVTEYDMDASLSGDYRPLVQFINSIERDKVFFIIRGVTLSGQQGGIVTLKLRLSTWIRPALPDDKINTTQPSAKEGH